MTKGYRLEVLLLRCTLKVHHKGSLAERNAFAMQGLHSVLCHCKPSAKLKAMDVMLACVQYNPQLLREHLLTEGAPPDILNGTGNHTSMFDILIG